MSKKQLKKQFKYILSLAVLILRNISRKDFLANTIKTGQCLTAKAKNITVGFAVLEQSFYGNGFISLLIVHPEYRKQSAAAALIRHVELICPKEKLFTSTNKSNIIMQRALKNLGFVKSGYIENLDENDRGIIHSKRLRKK